jgi:hypothetical protein
MATIFITTQAAAGVCGISAKFARYLIDAGLAPGSKKNGNRRQMPYDVALAIAARPAADLSVFAAPEVAVLRVAPAENPNEPGMPAPPRGWLGFRASLPSADLLNALNRWWRGDPARIAVGGYLPVTVGGFCVAVLSDLAGAVPSGTGNERRWYFPNARLLGHALDLADAKACLAAHLTPQEKAVVDALLARRLGSSSGGPIAYVTP